MILTKPPPTIAITFLLLLDSRVCGETVSMESMFNNSEVLNELNGVCWNQSVRVNEFLGVLEQGFVAMKEERLKVKHRPTPDQLIYQTFSHTVCEHHGDQTHTNYSHGLREVS